MRRRLRVGVSVALLVALLLAASAQPRRDFIYRLACDDLDWGDWIFQGCMFWA